MRIVPLTLLLLASLLLAPAASAKELSANVVSLPSDLVPGEAVPVVFDVYVLERVINGADIKHPVDVGGVSVVVSAAESSRERRVFGAEPVRSGRYRARIVFTAAGDWTLAIDTNDGHEPFALGKGAVSVPPAVERTPQTERAPHASKSGPTASASGFPLAPVLAGGVLLLIASALGERHRRRRR